ncbi:MAG: phosphotransferase [Deltaproteobacteria bacterium]|nr:phosphotransferase [Deltaproteobacteria bacterium]
MEDRQKAFSGVMPPKEGLEIDSKALDRYLSAYVHGYAGPAEVVQFRGGQSNPTYRIDTPRKRYVLRRKPPGKLLQSAHAVDREYRVITALAETDVPVPRTYLLCEDPEVIGTPFFVMDCMEGRIFWDSALPGLEPKERREIYLFMNKTIASLHNVDFEALGLSDYGKPGNYIARQAARWTKQYRASETEEIPEMNRLIEWLPQHIPESDETSIVHGDFRIDNLVFHPKEPRIIAILDWELSTLGDPRADFSYHGMIYQMPRDIFNGIAGIDLRSLGIPEEEEYISAYCRRTGRQTIENWRYYHAYNMFRLAAILQGIVKRHIDGTAASKQAEEMGRMARPLAELGWSQVEKLLEDSKRQK